MKSVSLLKDGWWEFREGVVMAPLHKVVLAESINVLEVGLIRALVVANSFMI